ncbi:hypothetical protein CRUP_009912 [Coryphaenoides rupestris]|nr:hypothetical protein CRUP_009912 [Coryphaenoides rupestris]
MSAVPMTDERGATSRHSCTSQISESSGGSFLSCRRRAKTCSECTLLRVRRLTSFISMRGNISNLVLSGELQEARELLGKVHNLLHRHDGQPWPQSQDPQNREVRQQRFAHFTELAIMSVQEIVDFAKQLPGFLELTREDQIALLKTSTIEG